MPVVPEQETIDPTPDEIMDKHPRWRVWVGVGGMLYAQLRRSSPAKTIRDENGTELMAAIASWERTNEPRPAVGDWPPAPWEVTT